MSLLKACSVLFLVNGWIINIVSLACHRYSEWREAFDNLSLKAFWTSPWWLKCELRQQYFTTMLYISVPSKVLLPPPTPQPAHKVQKLAISWTSVTRLSGTPCILPRWHYAISGASRKCFQFILLRPFISNSKWSGGYPRASHRGMCDTGNNLEEKMTCISVAGVLWVVVPSIQSWVYSLWFFFCLAVYRGW